MTQQRMFTVAQVAVAVGRSRSFVSHLATAGKLPGAVKDSKGWWQVPAKTVQELARRLPDVPGGPWAIDEARPPESAPPVPTARASWWVTVHRNAEAGRQRRRKPAAG